MIASIIGYGEIGSALHTLIKEKKDVSVRVWDKNASKLPNQGTIVDALRDTDLVFVCVPSWTLRGALREIRPHLKKTTGVVTLAKGIEFETQQTSDELLSDALPDQALGILGGPMIAEELMAGKPTTGLLGTRDPALRKAVRSIFRGTPLSIRANTDMRGVALCGVLKNTYVIALGIADGMSLGDNAKGVLISQAVREIARILRKLGGRASTMLTEAGIGDLFATGQSSHSRNHAVGVALGSGANIAELKSEGTMSLHCMEKLFGAELEDFPLLRYLVGVVTKKESPATLSSLL